MSRHEAQSVFHNAEITPDEITAADSAEFIIRLTVGPNYTEERSAW